jgi:hypothetical protein
MKTFPNRWLDSNLDNPVIRDYPDERITQYIIFGTLTGKAHCIMARTLSQLEIETK